MSASPKNFDDFWDELKRRRVIRGILAYGAGALLILESLDIILNSFGINQMPKLVIWILGIGFIVSVIFSWYYDFTHSGIQKTKPKNQISKLNSEKASHLGTWKITTFISLFIIVGLLALNVVRSVKGNIFTNNDYTIAVLPFDNLSDNEKFAYFGDAMTENISLQLGKINEFQVRSGTSVRQYKKTKKTSVQIGQELKVKYLIEGSTQRYENIMSITVHLIETKNDEDIWQKKYIRIWEEVTSLESEIAKDIARECKIVLTEDEKKSLNKKLTENPYAMDYYNLGNDYLNKRNYNATALNSAIQMYYNAIELDPAFAMAYAKLARTFILYHYQYPVPKGILLEKAKTAIDKAFKLEPDLPEANIALGAYYYYGYKDYVRALEQFQTVLKYEPDNFDALALSAAIYRRQGKWEMSQKLYQKILKSDPLDALILNNYAFSCDLHHNYSKALEYFDRALSIRPDWYDLYKNKINSLIAWKGDITESGKVLQAGLEATDFKFTETRALLDIYAGKYNNALKTLVDLGPEEFQTKGDYFLMLAKAYGLTDKVKMEKNYYDSAKVFFENGLRKEPDNAFLYSSLGIALAGLGDSENSINFGKKATEMLPVSQDVVNGPELLIKLAQIYIMTGKYSSAMNLIEQLLTMKSNFTVYHLKLDPLYKPLYQTPRFKELTRL